METSRPLSNIVAGLVQGAPLPPLALLPLAATAILTVAAGQIAVWAIKRVEL